MTIKLLADSGCDISLKEFKEKGIYLVPVKVLFGTEAYKDKVEITVEEFYEKLETAKNYPTTSQPSPQDFYEQFEKARDDDVKTLYSLTLSSKLSGTYQSAMIAKNMFDATYDDMEIILKDTYSATVPYAAMVYTMSDIINRGATISEIESSWKIIKEKTHLAGALTTLEYLQKSGRVGKAKAIVGKILSLRPMVAIINGEVASIGSAIGSDAALKKEVKYISQFFSTEEPVRAVYIDGLRPDLEAKLKEMVNEKFNVKKEHSITVGPAIGVHVGPEAVGVAMLPLIE